PGAARNILTPTGGICSYPRAISSNPGCGRARGGWVTSRMQPEDNVSFEPVVGRAPLILGGHDFHSITEAVAAPAARAPRLGWWLAFLASASMLGVLLLCIAWLFWEGIGIWGLNVPVGWAFDITNFVFWIGIGHAGTLISAILFLFRQRWRTSINR